MGWTDTVFEEPERVQFVKLERIGDSIEGIFAGTTERTNNFGRKEVHVLIKTGETPEGETIIESLRTNQRLLAQVAPVKRGTPIRIEYVEDRPNDGVDKDGRPLQPTKLFRVQVADKNASAVRGHEPVSPNVGKPVAEDDIPF